MKIAIIGAGAAGMMAAYRMKELSPETEVVLIEKNAVLGRKVVISGGGRCNLTTANTDVRSLMDNYPRGARWLKYAMHEFGPADVYQWFEDHGIPLKREKMKIFPISNKGTDVTAMFGRLFDEMGVEVRLKSNVVGLEQDGEEFVLKFVDGDELRADKVILTTGGNAYRHTGSTGDGYNFAQSMGHSVTDLAATLTSFLVEESWVGDLSGVSFENVRLKIVGEGKYEFAGALLFTHKGVSGPGVFALSGLSAFEKCSEQRPLKLFIDFVPDQQYEYVRQEIVAAFESHPAMAAIKALPRYVTKSLWEKIFQLLDLDKNKKASELGKKDLNRLIEFLKNCELQLVGRTPGAEIVTAGGVELSEVDKKTMESKICSGLFFAGEILNVDGFTGGYNLQIAWATGRLAGGSAVGV